MKISYDRKSDIMMLEISAEPIDHAEEIGPIIVHFTKEKKPVLLEILDASEFLTQATRITLKSQREELVDIAI